MPAQFPTHQVFRGTDSARVAVAKLPSTKPFPTGTYTTVVKHSDASEDTYETVRASNGTSIRTAYPKADTANWPLGTSYVTTYHDTGAIRVIVEFGTLEILDPPAGPP